jgi:PST family polysaccharide transporter
MYTLVKKNVISLMGVWSKRSTEQKVIISNMLWLSLDKVIRMGVGFLLGLWIARYLGPEMFGILSYAQAFVAIFLYIASLGLDSITIIKLIERPQDKDKILGTVFLLKLAGGFLAFLATTLLILLIQSTDTRMIWIVSITAAGSVFQSLDAIVFYYQSITQSKYIFYAKNGAFVLLSGAKMILIFVQAPLIAFAWAGLLEIVLGSLLLVFYYTYTNNKIRLWRLDKPLMLSLLTGSWPLVLSGMCIHIYMRVDQLLIEKWFGLSQVGVYTAATRLSEVLYFIPMSLIASMFPSILKAKESGLALYNDKLKKVFFLLSLFSYAVSIPMTLVAHPLIQILYGNPYAGSATVLQVHVWIILLVSFQIITSNWFVSEQKQIHDFYRNVFGLALNVGLNLLLLPVFGVMGAAYATILSFAAVVFMPGIYLRSYRSMLLLIVRSIALRR